MSETEMEAEKFGRHESDRFTHIINVAGTMTGLGASIPSPRVRDATADMMGRFIQMHELQDKASEVIAKLTGAEAGCMTASASAGITLSVAACMTGLDPAAVEALPRKMNREYEVVVQLGHRCSYGAPIETAISLTGASVHYIGQSTIAMDHQLESALNENTAAALYVVSHHVVHYGQIPFDRFVEICHAKGVPVIVDAASEYDLTGFLEAGADLVLYSTHKFLGGPTGGIIAGRRDLVRSAYLQNIGIGRGMKIGKESIAGAIAAMEQWMDRDHSGIKLKENAALDKWVIAVSGLPGITATKVKDPTGNPLTRLQIEVDPKAAGATAAGFSLALAGCDPSVIVRYHEIELGYFQLDPCNLLPSQSGVVADKLREILSDGSKIPDKNNDASFARNGGVLGYLDWGADK